jgi:hypothetical protein
MVAAAGQQPRIVEKHEPTINGTVTTPARKPGSPVTPHRKPSGAFLEPKAPQAATVPNEKAAEADLPKLELDGYLQYSTKAIWSGKGHLLIAWNKSTGEPTIYNPERMNQTTIAEFKKLIGWDDNALERSESHIRVTVISDNPNALDFAQTNISSKIIPLLDEKPTHDINQFEIGSKRTITIEPKGDVRLDREFIYRRMEDATLPTHS